MNYLTYLFLLSLPFIGLVIILNINVNSSINLIKRNKYELFKFLAGFFPPIPVSVIIPLYNKYIYLERCYKSLLNQTFQNFDIIYVDDFSSDNSSNFVFEKMKIDPRIKLVQHTYNQGTCNTRFHGVLFSTGKYIMQLDPDDIYYSDSINFLYHGALNLNADVIEMQIEGRKPYQIIPSWLPCRTNYTDREHLLYDLQRYDFKTTPWNINRKAVKNELYRKAVEFLIPFLDGKKINVAEDLIHSGAIFLFANNWICTGYIGYVYFMELPESSTTDYYQSPTQNSIQIDFSYKFMRYFYKNRFNLDKCSLDDFLSSRENLQAFNSITNLKRNPSRKKCDLAFNGYNVVYNEQNGYCFISR